MKTSRIWLFYPALLILSAGAGCSPKSIQPAPATLEFPTGKFANAGWSLDFKSDGTYVASGPAGSETGTYAVNRERVVITCQCCGPVAGMYTWTYDGKSLLFKAIDDQCSNRLEVVGSGGWSATP